MRDQTSWLRAIGGVWIAAGFLALIGGVRALLPLPSLLGQFVHLEPAVKAFWRSFSFFPWLQGMAIAIGAFGIVLGWSTIRRQSWVQTVLIPAHMLLLVYAAVGWIAAHLLQRSPETAWAGGPVLFALLLLVNGGLAFFLSGVGATEALSWLPLRTSPVIPMRCEFCGTPLDPQSRECPVCDVIPAISSQHLQPQLPRGRLVGLSDSTRYQVVANKKTFIGRGLTSNDIDLPNPTVSRHHAQIEYKEGHFVLTALQDSNGTYVNDVLVRQRTLREGDEVRFGRARFQFEIIAGEKE